MRTTRTADVREQGRWQDSASWVDAKALGDAAERAVARAFVAEGFDVDIAFGKRAHDLVLTKRAEVKNDVRAAESGFIALEVEHRGRPSGIANASAQLWVHVAGASALVGPPSAFRELADDERWSRVKAGDGGRSLIVLVPIEVALSHSQISPMPLDLQPE